MQEYKDDYKDFMYDNINDDNKYYTKNNTESVLEIKFKEPIMTKYLFQGVSLYQAVPSCQIDYVFIVYLLLLFDQNEQSTKKMIFMLAVYG